MAEAIAVLGTVAACAEIAKTISETIAFARKHVHSSASVKRDLIPLLGQLTAYRGLIEGIKCEAELDEADHGLLSVLSCVDGPLLACNDAVKAIHGRLEKLPKHLVVGKMIDSATSKALATLTQLKPILELSLLADQMKLTKAIEDYVRNIHLEVSALRSEHSEHAAVVESEIAKTQKFLEDSAIQNERQLKQSEKEHYRQQVLAWVSAVDPSLNFQAARKTLSPGVIYGSWLLGDERFIEWKTGQSHCLWLKGSSGSGKTVLTSIVIDHLRAEFSKSPNDKTLAYFFFDFNDPELQQSECMIRSVLLQLAIQHKEVFDRLSTLHDSRQGHGKVSADPVSWQLVLFQILGSELAYSDICIVIDGLDECADREVLELALNAIAPNSHQQWFLASQLAWDDGILGFPVRLDVSEVQMKVENVDRDIETYVDARLEQDLRLRRLSSEKKSAIKEALIEKSGGMFRWVQCQLDTLHELRDHRLTTIRAVLDLLPKSLNNTYRDILARIPLEEDSQTVMKILEFVAFSGRPVTVLELAEYAIIDKNTNSLSNEDRFDDFEGMLGLCGSLITVRNNQVLLAHESVKDFLTTNKPDKLHSQALTESEVHLEIGSTCLAYLQLSSEISSSKGEYDTRLSSNFQRLEELKKIYPFLDYACSMWQWHLAAVDHGHGKFEDQFFSSALALDGRNNLWTAWLCLQRADIWDRQISLAICLCESIIRLPQHSSWSAGFWRQRQLHRNTKAPPADVTSTGALSRPRDSIQARYGLSPTSVALASMTTNPAAYYMSLALLEVGLQQPIHGFSRTDWTLDRHLVMLLYLGREAMDRMGNAYGEAISAALHMCKLANRAGPWTIDELIAHAYEHVIDPLRNASEAGFRASVPTQRKRQTQLRGVINPMALDFAPRAATHSSAPFTVSSTSAYDEVPRAHTQATERVTMSQSSTAAFYDLPPAPARASERGPISNYIPMTSYVPPTHYVPAKPYAPATHYNPVPYHRYASEHPGLSSVSAYVDTPRVESVISPSGGIHGIPSVVMVEQRSYEAYQPAPAGPFFERNIAPSPLSKPPAESQYVSNQVQRASEKGVEQRQASMPLDPAKDIAKDAKANVPDSVRILLKTPEQTKTSSVTAFRKPHLSRSAAIQYIMDVKNGKPSKLQNQDLFIRLNQRNQVFLIDDCSGLTPYWPDVISLFGTMSYLVKESDPDGVNLYLSSSATEHRSRRTSRLMEKLKARQPGDFDDTGELATRLASLLSTYESQLSGQPKLESKRSSMTQSKDTRPLSLFIFTTGEQIFDVIRPIRVLADKLEEQRLPTNQVGVQLVTFSKSAHSPENMKKICSGINLVRHMVDSEPSDGNVWKMLLGSISTLFEDS